MGSWLVVQQERNGDSASGTKYIVNDAADSSLQFPHPVLLGGQTKGPKRCGTTFIARKVYRQIRRKSLCGAGFGDSQETTLLSAQIDDARAQTFQPLSRRRRAAARRSSAIPRMPEAEHVDRGLLDLVVANQNAPHLARVELFETLANARLRRQTAWCSGKGLDSSNGRRLVGRCQKLVQANQIGRRL